MYPEEVEEAIKAQPGVRDAVVVGVPDERFGEMVVAVVEPSPGASVDADGLVAELRNHLAGYKVPRRVLLRDVGRAPTTAASATTPPKPSDRPPLRRGADPTGQRIGFLPP